MNRWLFATNNKHKVEEAQSILQGFAEIISPKQIEIDIDVEETADSFKGNALLKALAFHKESGLPCFADDSGLCVRALQGAPGIFSARWGGEKRDFSEAMTRVWETLSSQKATDFRASFVCALAIVFPDGTESVFEGSVSGRISWPPKGDKGFGYDPIFIPNNHLQTFGEMDPSKKHFISHRADAMRKLIAAYCTV